MDIKKFEGSVSQGEFIQGLLLARGVETFGDIWEKMIDCSHCKFAKQCDAITEHYVGKYKNPRCGQIIDLLTGVVSAKDLEVKIEDL